MATKVSKPDKREAETKTKLSSVTQPSKYLIIFLPLRLRLNWCFNRLLVIMLLLVAPALRQYVKYSNCEPQNQQNYESNPSSARFTSHPVCVTWQTGVLVRWHKHWAMGKANRASSAEIIQATDKADYFSNTLSLFVLCW